MMRVFVFSIALLFASGATAKPLTDAQRRAIDTRIVAILKANDVPSASIAIVVDDQLDYAKAYGDQQINGSAPSTTVRYPLASISKQFTAAAILLLAEDGKMSLDDPVAKYLPALTSAKSVTIRELLGHTAGYRDYWPQDYRILAMTKPTTPDAILDRWAKAPLDFTPGSQYQYSNTGYTIAGVIAEIVAKEPLFAFEQRRIFQPLGMHVVPAATGLSSTDAQGTFRYALGPVRPSGGESAGWAFAAADLAMTPSELAKWNIARLNRSVLKPQSWQQQEVNVAPTDAGVQYGLGVRLDAQGQRQRILHNGAWTGYLLANRVYPVDHAAVTVFTNAGFSNSQNAIGDAIEAIIFETNDDAAEPKSLYTMLREGNFDRTKFTANGNSYFTPTGLADFQASLAPLGDPLTVSLYGPPVTRGGLAISKFVFTFKDRKLLAVLEIEPESRLVEQFTLWPFSE